ncbi:hypothetical protein ACPDHI_02225 [Myroides odoratimimus]|nr:hypothetical protein [Myroides odoratimimus]AJH13413.1 hypothetical protein MPR_0196 [Myroides profundi]
MKKVLMGIVYIHGLLLWGIYILIYAVAKFFLHTCRLGKKKIRQ